MTRTGTGMEDEDKPRAHAGQHRRRRLWWRRQTDRTTEASALHLIVNSSKDAKLHTSASHGRCVISKSISLGYGTEVEKWSLQISLSRIVRGGGKSNDWGRGLDESQDSIGGGDAGDDDDIPTERCVHDPTRASALHVRLYIRDTPSCAPARPTLYAVLHCKVLHGAGTQPAAVLYRSVRSDNCFELMYFPTTTAACAGTQIGNARYKPSSVLEVMLIVLCRSVGSESGCQSPRPTSPHIK